MGHFFVFKIIIFQSERLSIRRTLFDWSQRPYLIRPNNNIGSPTCSTIAFSWLLDLESTSNVSKNPLDLSNKSCPFSYTICCNLPSYSAVCIGIPVICILSNIIIISVHVCFCDCSIFCYSLIIIIKDYISSAGQRSLLPFKKYMVPKLGQCLIFWALNKYCYRG